MAKKRGVGLVVLTDVPGMGRVAILQVRGTFNPEKMGPESFPGACQVTVHGGLEGEESFEQSLMREIGEELGVEAFTYIQALKALGTAITRVKTHETDAKVMVTFVMLCPSAIIPEIRWEAGSGGMRLVTRKEISQIQDLSTFDKKTGVPDRQTIAMFSDEKEAVAKAFQMFVA